MALVLADRVRDTTTTTGTGTVTLSGTAPTGYQNFSVIGNANTTYYTINAGSQWEVGIGTYSSTGPTLSRDTVLESSNANALVNFSAGTKDVFVTYPSDKAVYYDAANNVGIGTSSPSVKLDVNGSASFGATITTGTGVSTGDAHLELGGNRTGSGNAYIDLHAVTGTDFEARIIRYGGTNSSLEINNTGTGGMLLNNSGAAPMVFYTTAAERMRIDSSGNVGIGTSAPASTFEVVSNASANIFSTNYSDNAAGGNYVGRKGRGTSGVPTAVLTDDQLSVLLGRGYTSAGAFSGNVGAIGVYAAENFTATNNGSYVAFATTAIGATSRTERMRIASDGTTKLSVGGVSDTHQFNYNESGGEIQLIDSTGAGPILLDNISGLARLYKVGTGAMSIGTTGANYLQYVTNSTERMRIDSSGNVGIGTSSPVQRLHVRQDQDGTTAALIQNRNGSGTPISAVQFISGAFDLSDNRYAMISSAGGSNTTLQFWTGQGAAPTERMRIDSSGNVGIGTSSPASLLHVKRGSNAIEVYPTGTWATRVINATDAAGENGLLVGNRWAGTDSTVFEAGSIFGGGTGSWYSYYRIDGTGQSFWSNGGTERMRLDTSGRLGIGTSAPGKTLDLVGQFRASGSAASGYALLEYGTSATATNNWHVGSEGDGTFRWYNGNFGAGTERMRITSAGNVGIGLTSLVSGYAGGGPALNIKNGGSVVWPNASGTWNTTTAGAAITYFTDNNLYIDAKDSASNMIFRVNGDTERVRITSAGNVGIGTSSPGAKLDVTGNIRLSAAGPNIEFNAGGGMVYGPAGNTLAFATGGGPASPVERARINSSGELLVGTTSGGRTVCINAADNWMRFQNPSRSWLIGPSNSTPFQIYDETGGYSAFNIDTSANINARNSIFLGAGQNLDNKIEIGSGRTGNNYAYIDLIGDTTYTDYGLRLIRGNGGANTTSQLVHRGTGDMYITTQDAAPMLFQTSSTTRMYIEAGGTMVMNGALLVGRNTVGSDVNTNNDTGSFSVRGDASNAASMSFHRTGAYAINMGLGTDNVFRIGGWSASSNCFQMDGSGNLTMLGNVTAYSDARMKKDVETIDSALDLVSKMRGVRYTRTDTQQRGVGVIAQEMLEVCPEVVQQGIGNDDTLSVAYGNLVGVLIEAIKELRAEVAELKGK